MYVYAADWEKADKAHDCMYRHLKSQSANNGRTIQELECEAYMGMAVNAAGQMDAGFEGFS